MTVATLPTPASPPKPRPSLVAAVEWMRAIGPGESALFHGLTWDEYDWFDRQRDHLRPGVRLSYDRGVLEVMTVSYTHDRASEKLRDIVLELAYALNVSFEPTGRTTYRRQDLDRGLEPDECFYFQNAPAIRGLAEIDLSVHPPPDLAIEVDHTRSSLAKQPVYAALGVPELWRFDGTAVVFMVLQTGGVYQPQHTSRTFPVLAATEVTRLLLAPVADYNAFTRAVRAWAAALAPQQP
jgi:Uma2 family endonuclease